jgi:hypothetical protein
MAQDDALHQAFSLVLSTASPEVARRALRAGLIALLAEEPRRPSPPETRRHGGWPKGKKRGPRPPRSSNGALSKRDREQLSFLVQAGHAVDVGVGAAIVQQAIDGATLEPAVAGRLKEFLAR